MFKFEEILKAWIAKWNPTPEQVELAEKRYAICEECPSRKIIENPIRNFYVCGECGCPLEGKTFSQKKEGACPLGKWDEVDKNFK